MKIIGADMNNLFNPFGRVFHPFGGGDDERYLLCDDFTDVLAAGNVNGTLAKPGPGTRNVTDTAGTKVITTGTYLQLGGTGTWEQSKINLTPTIVREAGRVIKTRVNNVDGMVGFIGAATATTAFTDHNSVGYDTSATHVYTARRTSAGTSVAMFTGIANTYYTFWSILRNIGKYTIVKGADGVNRLWWMDEWSNTTPLYVAANVNTNVRSLRVSTMRVPKQYYSIQSLASDSFNRADGVLGDTDGAGHAEANSGANVAWTASVGTWAISTAKAMCTALDGGLGMATLSLGSKNVFARVKTTRAGDQVGLMLRYVDADNYLYAYHDGTNAALIQRLAGVESNIIAPAAATYAAGAYLTAIVDDNNAFLAYNDLKVGAATTINAGMTGTKHGLWSTNTGNSFTDLAIFPSQGYTDLDNF